MLVEKVGAFSGSWIDVHFIGDHSRGVRHAVA
jgi:hypothetical protein